jgi:uncharacterized protein (TIGR00369 family)
MWMVTIDQLNQRSVDRFPGYVGLVFTGVGDGTLDAQLEIKPFHIAPNGYLHAAVIVTLADTACGYGCYLNLPEGASGFTTMELKTNYLGTARDGVLTCRASIVHAGRTTQVWDAVVAREGSVKPMALFRCTQMILYPRSEGGR